MSGHSARRSGAMMYTRLGIDIQTVGFMGRWRSSAVFRYVEEATKELPLNHRTKLNHSAMSNRWPAGDSVRPSEELQTEGSAEAPKDLKAGEEPPAVDPELWAVSRSRGKTVIHRVKEASWNLQLNEWKTACGWHFARHNVKVELTKLPPESATCCVKCDRLESMRDDVRKAREWAHTIQIR